MSSNTKLNMAEEETVNICKLWHYLLLCASLLSNEMGVTYQLLYLVTWGQMLGLPLQIVTLPGVLSACFSFIAIPVMGKFGDRGNVRKRKSFLILVSGALQIMGASCIIIACVVKVMDGNVCQIDTNINGDCNGQNMTAEIIGLQTYGSQVNKTTGLLTNWSETAVLVGRGCAITEGQSNSHDVNGNQCEHTVITGTLAFIGFVVIDCGYDTGSSNIRGFVMECVEPSHHSKILTIGVLMSGIGGCALALMGLGNYDGLTGAYHDPTLDKAIALSIFVIIFNILSNVTTLLMGRHLVSKRKNQLNIAEDKDASNDVLKIAENGSIINESLLQRTAAQTNFIKKKTYSERFLKEILNVPSHAKSFWRSKKKKLLLLYCFLCFFTSGTVISFEVYFGNFLAQDVYHGDSNAPANTEAKENFEEAMKTASVGAFIIQFMFLLYTVFHEKIASYIGPLVEVLIVSLVSIPLVLSFALTKELSIFYATALVGGLNMTLMFTTPFTLAAETIEFKENSETYKLLNMNQRDQIFLGNVKEGSDDSNYGSTISKVAMTIPLMYMLISAIMGPMLEATGNAASPLYFSVASSFSSIGVLILIALVERRRSLIK